MDPDLIEITPEGQWVSQPTSSPRVLLPGSFNPVHEGHWSLADAAQCWLGETVAFEMSRSNVDKPALEDDEVRRRAAQFTARSSLWITRAATFVAKAALFPGTVFVVGADTAARIVSVRYYGQSDAAMLVALRRIHEQQCRFLVGGRVDAGGRFVRLRDLPIPAGFHDLFVELPAETFRCDVSSTALRNSGTQP